MRHLVTLVALVAPAVACNLIDWTAKNEDFEKQTGGTTMTDGTTTAMTTDTTGTSTEADTTSTLMTSETTETGTQTETSSDPTKTTGMTTEAPCGDGVCAGDETYSSCPADCAPICGDSVVEGDEACDDGNADNTDACVEGCKMASCGDSFVEAGKEECDDGNLMNGDGCENSCMLSRRIVFVTSEAYQGNMRKMGDMQGLTGLSGADAQCNARAQAAGLSGTFKAWLSDTNSSPSARFTAASMPSFAGLYILADGITKVADGWSGLIDGSLDHAIDMTEAKISMQDVLPWSNTDEDGTQLYVDRHCVNWGSPSGMAKGATGYSQALDIKWTNYSTPDCSSPRQLYCFEDPE